MKATTTAGLEEMAVSSTGTCCSWTSSVSRRLFFALLPSLSVPLAAQASLLFVEQMKKTNLWLMQEISGKMLWNEVRAKSAPLADSSLSALPAERSPLSGFSCQTSCRRIAFRQSRSSVKGSAGDLHSVQLVQRLPFCAQFLLWYFFMLCEIMHRATACEILAQTDSTAVKDAISALKEQTNSSKTIGNLQTPPQKPVFSSGSSICAAQENELTAGRMSGTFLEAS